MFERFTISAAQAIELSIKEAHGLGHNAITPEMLLLGLLAERHGLAGVALRERGISLATVEQQVIELLGRGNDEETEEPPFSDAAQAVLELAWDENRLDHDEPIGTHHLLRGLLRRQDKNVTRLLGLDSPELSDLKSKLRKEANRDANDIKLITVNLG